MASSGDIIVNMTANTDWKVPGLKPGVVSVQVVKNRATAAIGKIFPSWKKEKVVGGKCFRCDKAIKNEVHLDLNIIKDNIWSNDKNRTMDFHFYIHKSCLIFFLEDCPFEDVTVLKEIDLTSLDSN